MAMLSLSDRTSSFHSQVYHTPVDEFYEPSLHPPVVGGEVGASSSSQTRPSPRSSSPSLGQRGEQEDPHSHPHPHQHHTSHHAQQHAEHHRHHTQQRPKHHHHHHPHPSHGLTADDVPDDDDSDSPQDGPNNQSGREAGRQIEPGQEETASQDEQGVQQRKPSTLHRVLRHGAILGLLAFAAIWGTLTREGLTALNTYSGASISPVIWSQAVGCLVMGWTVANKEALELWYPPIFIFFGTGYCGSVTTFSTWILDVFIAYSNQSHYNRHGLHNVMDALTQTFATLGMSLVALAAGKQLARILPATLLIDVCDLLRCRRPRRVPRPGDSHFDSKLLESSAASSSSQQVHHQHRSHQDQNQSQHQHQHQSQSHQNNHIYPPRKVYPSSSISGKPLPSSAPRRPQPPLERSNPAHTLLVDGCCLVLGLCFWLGAIFFAAFYNSSLFRPVTLAITFGPLGTILRWYLSRLNSAGMSKRLPYYPMGTFIANMLATAILCASYVGQHYGSPTSSPSSYAAKNIVTCQVLHGIQEGFCGCLSTISTFVVELRNMKPRRRALGYVLGSYALGVLLCILIVGVPWWAGQGMEGSCNIIE